LAVSLLEKPSVTPSAPVFTTKPSRWRMDGPAEGPGAGRPYKPLPHPFQPWLDQEPEESPAPSFVVRRVSRHKIN
jgi:hypothetical protein